MAKLYNLTVSIVLFKTEFEELEHVLQILQKTELKIKIYLVDNSPTPLAEDAFSGYSNVEYIFTGKNLGFGTAHNIAIKNAREESDYHLVLNADVSFDAEILSDMHSYMEKHRDVGLLAPKIFNPDGSLQYSVKLLPTPANLIVRRFVPIESIQKRMDERYELRFFNFDRIIEVPYVMGCFMYIRTKVFDQVNGFDERFFMYPEDIDLTRRIHKHYKTLFFPESTIVHQHGRGSYKNKLLLYYHVSSMIRYFNKWGWIFDRERRKINKRILKQLQEDI